MKRDEGERLVKEAADDFFYVIVLVALFPLWIARACWRKLWTR